MRLSKPLPEPLLLRPRNTVAVLPGGILLVIIGLYIYVVLRRDPSVWLVPVVLVLVFVYGLVWLRSFRLTLTSEKIHYRTLWSDRTLLLSDIESAELRGGFETAAERWQPLFRLELYPYPESGRKTMVVNYRIFDGLDELFEYLPVKEPEETETEVEELWPQ